MFDVCLSLCRWQRAHTWRVRRQLVDPDEGSPAECGAILLAVQLLDEGLDVDPHVLGECGELFGKEARPKHEYPHDAPIVSDFND